MKKLNYILLIDDNEADNYYHTRVIKFNNYSNDVISTQNAEEALRFLVENKRKGLPQPEVILLDINMPGMDGWEFLEHYEKLDKSIKDESMLVMLTTSVNPTDEEKAKNFPDVRGFLHKPLKTDSIDPILEQKLSYQR